MDVDRIIGASVGQDQESGHEDAIIQNLNNLGFEVVPNHANEDDMTYTVRRDGKIGLLDLSSFEDMHDSLRMIEAEFDLNMSFERSPDTADRTHPTMNTKHTGQDLAQRVAAIGESQKELLPIKATSMCQGKTYHHSVYIVAPDVAVRFTQKAIGRPAQPVICIEGTPGGWYASDFMHGSGPLAIDHGQGWVLVNADEIRDLLRPYLRNIPPGDDFDLPSFGDNSDENSFAESL